jgi:hypothetical protein
MGLKPQVTMDFGEILIDINVSSTISQVMDFSGWRGSVQSVIIDGPGTLTGTATVQVSHSMEDTDEYGTTWRDLQSAGSDITVPADGSIHINSSGFRRLRISSSAAEAANRRFRIRGIEAAS